MNTACLWGLSQEFMMKHDIMIRHHRRVLRTIFCRPRSVVPRRIITGQRSSTTAKRNACSFMHHVRVES